MAATARFDLAVTQAKPMATKVDQVASAIAQVAINPQLQPLEQLWSCEPNDSWYDAARSPSNYTRFEIGNYQVPNGQALLLLDFDFQPFAPTGHGPYESAPVAEGHLTGSLGFALEINGSTPGQVRYELEPTPSNFQQRRFRPQPSVQIPLTERVQADYQRTLATSYAAATFGTNLLPVRRGRSGAPSCPWSVVALEGESVTMTGMIYRPIPYPLSMIRGRIMGYTGSLKLVKQLLSELAQTAQTNR
jgi:hypothetical protein